MWGPAFSSQSSTVSKDLKCSSSFDAVTKMSTKYMTILGIPCIILSMTLWKMLVSAEIQKGNCVYIFMVVNHNKLF